MISIESVANEAVPVDGADYLICVFLGGCSKDCQLVVPGECL